MQSFPTITSANNAFYGLRRTLNNVSQTILPLMGSGVFHRPALISGQVQLCSRMFLSTCVQMLEQQTSKRELSHELSRPVLSLSKPSQQHLITPKPAASAAGWHLRGQPSTGVRPNLIWLTRNGLETFKQSSQRLSSCFKWSISIRGKADRVYGMWEELWLK